MKRRLLSILCALALCLGLLPMTASAAGVDYIERSWDSSTNTVKSEPKNSPDTTTEVTANDTQWSSGWYVAQGEVTIGQRVTVTGEVHLILADGCTLTVNGGIRVAAGNSLTVYAQSFGDKMGKLVATVSASDSNAAIGGDSHETAGTITISGGTITATGQGGGAGIGGGGGTSGLGDAGSFSTGDNGSAVIFASGSSAIQDTEDLADPWQGVIFLGNSGAVYGNRVTPTEDFTIPSGKALTIDSGKTLIIPEGVILANKGTITNNGEIIVYGTLEGSGSIEGSGTFPVTGVTLDKTSLTLTVGGTGTLTAAVQPSSASNKTLTWSSDNEAIATVDDSGKVTAVGAGTAVITATAADGSGKSASCTVTVTEPYVPPVPLRRTTATPPTPSPGPERWRGAGSP